MWRTPLATQDVFWHYDRSPTMSEQSLATYYSLLGLQGIKGTPAKTLFEKNPIVKDAPVIQGNEKMGHAGSRDSSIPAPAFRKLNAYKTPGVAHWSPWHEDISIAYGASA